MTPHAYVFTSLGCPLVIIETEGVRFVSPDMALDKAHELAKKVNASLKAPARFHEEAMATEKARSAELRELLRERTDGAWVWETGGENDLESLTGPILITADTLREMLAPTQGRPTGEKEPNNEALHPGRVGGRYG